MARTDMTRVMLDTNAYDAILKYGDAERIKAASLDVIATDAQEDEISQIRDGFRRGQLMSLFMRNQPVVAPQMAWDASRDAIIGAAAAMYADLLVTDDKALTAQLARTAPKLRVLTYENFRKEFLT
jgi:predicted nucleic acid-binding protein